jgi:hypothetical protein
VSIADVYNIQRKLIEAQRKMVKNEYVKELLINDSIELDFIWVYELSAGVLTGSAEAAIKLVADQRGYTIRVIHPHDIVTQDVDPSRLNILVDDNDKIIKVGLY